MEIFDQGETVICSIKVRDEDEDLKDPATSMNVEVFQNLPYTTIVSSTAMTKDSTGTYHYDFHTSAVSAATYTVVYTATDGARITIKKDTIVLD